MGQATKNTSFLSPCATNARNIRRNQTGGVMVEAAISFPLFFFVLFVFMEIILSTYNWAIIQFSLDSISRDSLVQVARTPAEIEQLIIDRVAQLGLGVQLQPNDILICGQFDGSCRAGAAESRGAAGGLFMVQIRHSLDFSFSPWSWTIQNTLFVRNEPR